MFFKEITIAAAIELITALSVMTFGPLGLLVNMAGIATLAGFSASLAVEIMTLIGTAALGPLGGALVNVAGIMYVSTIQD